MTISVPEIAAALGCSVQRARELLRQGRIPHIPRAHGRREHYIVSRVAFLRWLEAGGEAAEKTA